jgi:hypothetical protein
MPLSPEARKSILANLDAGQLPLDAPQRMYAGYGQGHTCDGCGETIDSAQVEYEAVYADGRAYRLHLACAGLWERERGRRSHKEGS